MLNKNEFRSVWEIAHLWEDVDVPQSDAANLSDGVSDKLYIILWAFLRKHLPLRTARGYRIYNEPAPLILIFLDINWKRRRLEKMVDTNRYDRDFLDSIYVMRPEFLAWCRGEFLLPPGIWMPSEQVLSGPGVAREEAAIPEKALVGRHRDDEINKQLCQAIARTLWDIDPQIHPAHMAKARPIQLYGNAKLYKDEETVRDWLADVDPMRKQRKTGRPPVVGYRIDLETGRLKGESSN